MAQTQQPRNQRPPQQAQPPAQAANAGALVRELRVESRERIIAFIEEIEQHRAQLARVLPSGINPDRFIAITRLALMNQPDLMDCDRGSLYDALRRCALDGLNPDGREAVILPYRNVRKKVRDPRTGIDHEYRVNLAQYQSMIAGVRKRMQNSGLVISAVAEVVYRNDHFLMTRGDDPRIEHRPTQLGDDPGELIGAYAIIRLKDGEVIRDAMSKKEIEHTRRTFSKQPDSPAWEKSYGEMAKKTVLRRAAKQAPQRSDDLEMLARDDDDSAGDLTGATPFPALPQQHQPAPVQQRLPEPEPAEVFAVIDLDGVEHEFQSEAKALDALKLILADAKKQGPARLDGAWESQGSSIAYWSEAAQEAARQHYMLAFEDARASKAEAKPAPKPEPKPPQVPFEAERQPPPTSAEVAEHVADEIAQEAAGSPLVSEDVQATETPPAAEAPHSAPPAAAADDENRESLAIGPPPAKNGKPDWRAWAFAMLLPKVRRETNGRTLAFLRGDNAEAIEECRRALSPADLKDFDAQMAAADKAATWD